MQLAYLIAEAVDDSSWAGGLLVTDDRGLPVDFRYVDPIAPSRLQKLIYGESLRRCLLLDAISGTLLKAANPKVDWIFTLDPLLLELDTKISARIVVVENGEKEPMSETGEWKVDRPGEITMQISPTGPPARLMFKVKNDSETEMIAKELAKLSSILDFAEPLKRVGSALKEICSTVSG
jgi:hypothetical protein